MAVLELKSKIHTYIEQADERFLKMVEGLFNNYYGNRPLNEIIGHTVQGEPLTKEKYIQRIKQAEENIDAGKFTTHEDLLNEMKDW